MHIRKEEKITHNIVINNRSITEPAGYIPLVTKKSNKEIVNMLKAFIIFTDNKSIEEVESKLGFKIER